MKLILSALISTILQVVLVLIALSVLISLAILVFVLLDEAVPRLKGRLRSRRAWKEIEECHRQLESDEHLGKLRLGAQREHVAGRRAS